MLISIFPHLNFVQIFGELIRESSIVHTESNCDGCLFTHRYKIQ